VRNNAISVAISVVEKVIASNIKLDESNALIDVAISDVASKLH
jgi:hypothetical protein